MVDDLLKEGIVAVKAGQKSRANALLREVVRQRPNDVTAWLWLSGAVETDDERRQCLERVLSLDPNNLHALKGLQKLGPVPRAVAAPGVTITSAEPQQAKPTSQPQPPQLSSEPRSTPAAKVWDSKRPWYFSPLVLVLTFLFFTPLWALLIQRDKRQSRGVKILAGIIGLGYLLLCGNIFLNFLAETTGPSTAPSQVKILEGWYCDYASFSSELVVFEGMVRNVGSRDVRRVELRGTILTPEGEVFNTNTAFVDSDILVPNATSTFSFYIKDPYYYTGKHKCKIEVEDYLVRK